MLNLFFIFNIFVWRGIILNKFNSRLSLKREGNQFFRLENVSSKFRFYCGQNSFLYN